MQHRREARSVLDVGSPDRDARQRTERGRGFAVEAIVELDPRRQLLSCALEPRGVFGQQVSFAAGGGAHADDEVVARACLEGQVRARAGAREVRTIGRGADGAAPPDWRCRVSEGMRATCYKPPNCC